MNGIRLAWADIKYMWHSNILRLTVLGLMIVPLIYSFIYLWAVWNPTDYLKNYPLVVVNRDQGITQKALHINVGKRFVHKLLTNERLNWKEVSLADADRGVAEGKYYAAVIIPPDFTQQAYSASTEHPEKVKLTYKINEGASSIGATYTRQIMDRVIDALRQELTTRYLEVVFDLTLEGGQGLRKAANGAAQLATGTDQAYDGSTRLANGLSQARTGMDKLGSGLVQLNTGANQFENGTIQLNTLIQVLSTAAQQLTGSIDPTVARIKDINSNLEMVADSSSGITLQMRDALRRYGDIADSAYDLAQDTKQLNNTIISPVPRLLMQQDQRLTAAETSLNDLIGEHPELKDDPRVAEALSAIEESRAYRNDVLQSGMNAANSLHTLEYKIQANAANARANKEQLDRNLTSLSAGLDNLNPTAFNDEIDADAASLKKAATAIVKFSSDAQKLQDGSTQLVNGLNTFSDGFTQLRVGTEKLADGSQQLQTGLAKIDAGQHLLANKLDEGANMARDDGHTQERIAAIADPVLLKEDNIHPVPNNGTGFAPYFIAISLWVGSLLLFFIVDLKRVRAIPKNPFHYIINKYLAMASVVVFQAAILVFILHNGLGIVPVSTPIQMYAFALLTGLVFSAILFMLVGIFGEDIGRYIAIIIMMLQLTSCGGSYPVELEAQFFGFIKPLLPMTYAVHGLRDIISTGDHMMAWPDALTLLGYAVGSLIVLYLFKHKRILHEIEEREPIAVVKSVEPVPAAA